MNATWCVLFLLTSAVAVADDRDSWMGKSVYYRETAEVRGNAVNLNRISFPAVVEQEDGEWLCLGRGWVKKSDVMEHDQALIYFSEQIKEHPSEAPHWSRRAAVLMNSNEIDAAIKDLGEAIRIEPRYAAAYCNRGVAWQKKGNFAAAIEDYDQSIRLNPRDAISLSNRAIVFGLQGNAEMAIKDYTQAIWADPQYTRAYINRGYEFDAKGQHSSAIRDYSNAIRLNPNSSEAYCRRGSTKNEQGDHDGAIKDLTETIRTAGNISVDDQLILASANHDSDDVIKLKQEFSPAFYYLIRGSVYEQKGALDAAIADYSQSIRLAPRNVSSYAVRGSAWHDKGNFDAAITDFDEAIRLDSQWVTAYRYRGLARTLAHDYSGATHDFAQALQLKPDSKLACRDFARLLATCPLGEYRNGPKAFALATQACMLDNWKSPQSISVLAAACAEAGDWTNAVNRQKQALELTTDPKAKQTRHKYLEQYERQIPLRDLIIP